MNPFNKGCLEYRTLPHLSRRNALKIGALSTLGLTLPQILRHEASANEHTSRPRARSVILLWLQGGVTHHETFDPKPDAAEGIRGEMSTIQTAMPGVRFSETLPKLARIADKLAVVRSVTHSESSHQRGSMYMVEGRRPPRAVGVNASGHPEIGSMVAHQLGMRNGLPPFVSIPGNDFTSGFTGHGYLPATAMAFRGYQSQSLQTNDRVTAQRFDDRVELRDVFENGTRTAPGSQQSWDRFDERAVDIITSGRGAAAFDVDSEPVQIQRMYGIEPGRRGSMGRLTLTARRLVEAGVRYVTIGRNSWDHHSNIFPQLRDRLPRFDDAFSGLVMDLEQRGMLDETLVVYMTEYGRTPRINNDAGRDHWPAAFSIAFAGVGIRPGQVIGSSDRDGAQVSDSPVSPEEIAATILHLVGIEPQQEFIKSDGRPIAFVDRAQPLRALLG